MSPNSCMKFTIMVVVEMLATRVFAGRDEVAQYFIMATQTLLMIKPSSKTEMRLNNPLIYILFYFHSHFGLACMILYLLL